MNYGLWLGILSNFSLGIPGWIFAGLLSIIFISAITYGIHFYLKGKHQTITMLAAFSLALFLFGILGFFYFGSIYLVSFALFSDFRRDYK
jgi:hypothetical protein